MLTEHNNGVYYSAMLEAVASDQAAVAARGIKRAEDKVRAVECALSRTR